MTEGDAPTPSKVRAGWLTTDAGMPVPFAVAEGWLECLDCGKSYDTRENFIAHSCDATTEDEGSNETETVTAEENDA